MFHAKAILVILHSLLSLSSVLMDLFCSDRFNPVLEAAESLNTVDIVVIATPMWNYSIPYVLKQYIGKFKVLHICIKCLNLERSTSTEN